jgi:flagellar biosynthetic protein FlhB
VAEDEHSQEDRTEEASPERREEFREKGQVAVSREITSVVVLAASVGFLTFYVPHFIQKLAELFVKNFQILGSFRVSSENFLNYSLTVARDTVILITPVFLVTMVASTASTFLQSRFNFSWNRLKPDFSRLDPLKGVVRIVSWQSLVELVKGICKMTAVGLVAYLVLKSEWQVVPGLLLLDPMQTWGYWGQITTNLFWGVATLLVVVAAIDYAYNFFSLERKMKMTKQEVKEEYKRREVDPHVRNRIRRMQREMANKRMVERTEQATVLITNPTHYSIALRYEIGMAAPLVVAKGVDFLALQMRERANEKGIPIVENKPLARTLYKMVEVDSEIPESLYKAVSEVIRYVFKLKGISTARERVS